jgi:hypothetical protein
MDSSVWKLNEESNVEMDGNLVTGGNNSNAFFRFFLLVTIDETLSSSLPIGLAIASIC